MNLLIVYLIISGFTSLFIFDKLEREHATGDDLLLYAEHGIRKRFLNNPSYFKFCVAMALIIMGLVWPYTLYIFIEKKNNEMDNIDFKPEEWQGKRKDQVESSYKIFWWSLVGIIVIITILMFLGWA